MVIKIIKQGGKFITIVVGMGISMKLGMIDNAGLALCAGDVTDDYLTNQSYTQVTISSYQPPNSIAELRNQIYYANHLISRKPSAAEVNQLTQIQKNVNLVLQDRNATFNLSAEDKKPFSVWLTRQNDRVEKMIYDAKEINQQYFLAQSASDGGLDLRSDNLQRWRLGRANHTVSDRQLLERNDLVPTNIVQLEHKMSKYIQLREKYSQAYGTTDTNNKQQLLDQLQRLYTTLGIAYSHSAINPAENNNGALLLTSAARANLKGWLTLAAYSTPDINIQVDELKITAPPVTRSIPPIAKAMSNTVQFGASLPSDAWYGQLYERTEMQRAVMILQNGIRAPEDLGLLMRYSTTLIEGNNQSQNEIKQLQDIQRSLASYDISQLTQKTQGEYETWLVKRAEALDGFLLSKTVVKEALKDTSSNIYPTLDSSSHPSTSSYPELQAEQPLNISPYPYGNAAWRTMKPFATLSYDQTMEALEESVYCKRHHLPIPQGLPAYLAQASDFWGSHYASMAAKAVAKTSSMQAPMPLPSAPAYISPAQYQPDSNVNPYGSIELENNEQPTHARQAKELENYNKLRDNKNIAEKQEMGSANPEQNEEIVEQLDSSSDESESDAINDNLEENIDKHYSQG
jgi:hypothetical protein